MADWDIPAIEYAAYVSEWVTKYGIDFSKSISNDEMTQEQYDMLLKLNKDNLVWTEHNTCEDDMYSTGFSVMGDCSLLDQEAGGCGCWQSWTYHIGTKPWVDESEYVLSTVTLPCESCNPDGQGEGVEGCEGPETIDGTDHSDCVDGMINWYFD